METDCSSVERITSTSRGIIWRSRGRLSAATMAPAPMEASSSVKVPASPPCRPRATSGSRASSAVEWKKKMAMRSSTARRRADWPTNCRPTRMALTRRSRPSGLGAWSRRQRMMTKPETTDSTALSTKTYSVPAPAISAPATSGPTMREAFMETPLSASAAGSCTRGTSSGTMAGEHRPAHRQAHAVGKGQRQQQGGRHDARDHRDGQQRGHAGHPELRHDEVAAPVQDVGQRAAGQAQQEHRQRGGRLHQRHPDRRGGHGGHHPGGRHVVHPHADVGDQPGAPQHAEHRALDGRPGGEVCGAAAGRGGWTSSGIQAFFKGAGPASGCIGSVVPSRENSARRTLGRGLEGPCTLVKARHAGTVCNRHQCRRAPQ